ncbi:4-carboxymuconolactone decarboxylase [Pantoea sp. PNA 14-12]|uniref:carboxymuconolactone decarboxylase family protein n=1 Tax=Pantoea TaxID=53335 RepID=UPI00050FC7AC|nr:MULTISPECIES: carboxymuconolactone decarboxylase family protein [Pantoea]KGD79861.1 carboxymuconolactone decarboxylase [Pantoea stewartii subsp. indologenes]NRH24839.1 carboxymuconolactone decarboxylase [Pantoea stewartii]TDS67836.1 4-carboxymuconolactone decarboxylase [Pantoea sp. PNA 14-12]
MNPLPLTRENLAEIAPRLAALSEDILFGDIWQRDGLSPRDRSLITVSALIALNRPEQLSWHLKLARKNGLSEAELTEMMTHLAFYCGWPAAVSALTVFKNTLSE